MTSSATIVTDRPGLVLVRVDHRDTDSLSRSVLVAADRAWRRSSNISPRHRDMWWDTWDIGSDRVTFAAYAATLPEAAAAIAGHAVSLIGTATDPLYQWQWAQV